MIESDEVFGVEVEVVAGVRYVRLCGELDLATLSRFELATQNLSWGEASVVLDLRRLTFIDSTGLSGIIWADRLAKAAGTRLRLIAGPSNVHRAFEIAGLLEAFTWIQPPGAHSEETNPTTDRR